MNTNKCEKYIREEILDTAKEIVSLVATKNVATKEKQQDIHQIVEHLVTLSSSLKHVEFIRKTNKHHEMDG